MTLKEKERLAVLETQFSDLKIQLEKNTRTTEEVLETLNRLTGGQKALMWVTGITIAIAGIIMSILNYLKEK